MCAISAIYSLSVEQPAHTWRLMMATVVRLSRPRRIPIVVWMSSKVKKRNNKRTGLATIQLHGAKPTKEQRQPATTCSSTLARCESLQLTATIAAANEKTTEWIRSFQFVNSIACSRAFRSSVRGSWRGLLIRLSSSSSRSYICVSFVVFFLFNEWMRVISVSRFLYGDYVQLLPSHHHHHHHTLTYSLYLLLIWWSNGTNK